MAESTRPPATTAAAATTTSVANAAAALPGPTKVTSVQINLSVS